MADDTLLHGLRKVSRENLPGFLERELSRWPLKDRERLILRAIIELAPDLEEFAGSQEKIAAKATSLAGELVSIERVRRAVRGLKQRGLIVMKHNNGNKATYLVQHGRLIDGPDFPAGRQLLLDDAAVPAATPSAAVPAGLLASVATLARLLFARPRPVTADTSCPVGASPESAGACEPEPGEARGSAAALGTPALSTADDGPQHQPADTLTPPAAERGPLTLYRSAGDRGQLRSTDTPDRGQPLPPATLDRGHPPPRNAAESGGDHGQTAVNCDAPHEMRFIQTPTHSHGVGVGGGGVSDAGGGINSPPLAAALGGRPRGVGAYGRAFPAGWFLDSGLDARDLTRPHKLDELWRVAVEWQCVTSDAAGRVAFWSLARFVWRLRQTPERPRGWRNPLGGLTSLLTLASRERSKSKLPWWQQITNADEDWARRAIAEWDGATSPPLPESAAAAPAVQSRLTAQQERAALDQWDAQAEAAEQIELRRQQRRQIQTLCAMQLGRPAQPTAARRTK